MGLRTLWKFKNGNLVPADSAKYKKLASYTLPDLLEDPEHFGYPVWKCCRLIESINDLKKESNVVKIEDSEG
jgi:hypothetical protein